jgi:phosphoserine aminotransferase
MEHSHRSKEYEAVHNEAISLLRELLIVPATHEILFLQGGASMQFALVPMNFLPPGGLADHVVTGAFGEKGQKEAAAWASVIGARARVAGSTKEGGYRRVLSPAEVPLSEGAAYVHWTSNETINGVQYADLRSFGALPQVCDLSSDFMSRPMSVGDFALCYAGAQKNLGPSGVTVVLVEKSFLDTGRRDLPSIVQYRAHAEANSLLNTPPTFAIYLMRNVLLWIKAVGGLSAVERRNRTKAATVYGAIDRDAGFYRASVDAGSRSLMNAVFRLPSEALDKKFVDEAKAQGMMGLKGHRSVGGIRASLYNAVEPDWTVALASFMGEFARRNG